MGRKPSASKKIAEVLDTPDKRVQLERVQTLVQIANDVPVAVTVLSRLGKVIVSVSSSQRIGSPGVKRILSQAIDELTRMEVTQEMSQEEEELLAATDPLEELLVDPSDPLDEPGPALEVDAPPPEHLG